MVWQLDHMPHKRIEKAYRGLYALLTSYSNLLGLWMSGEKLGECLYLFAWSAAGDGIEGQALTFDSLTLPPKRYKALPIQIVLICMFIAGLKYALQVNVYADRPRRPHCLHPNQQ